MTLKKIPKTNDEEIVIFDEAVIYKRGEYWQFRLWLPKEDRYARQSLRTRSKSTAIDKGKEVYLEILANNKAGKTYFSQTTKQGVAMYVKQRQKDVELGNIVKVRLSTIKTHLEHWLEFIGRDTKLKELGRMDCEDYFYSRIKSNKKISVSQSTVLNEQSTINSMMSYLFKHNETYINEFDFPKVKKIDRGNEELRRALFTEDEIRDIKYVISNYILEAKKEIDKPANLNKFLVSYYFLVAMSTGLRTGEQRQLTWGDVVERIERYGPDQEEHSVATIKVRDETSKVRNTRVFKCVVNNEFTELQTVLYPLHKMNKAKKVHECLIFSADGDNQLSKRAIGYHFHQILDLAEVKNTDKRDLVPYSFRHNFITAMVKSGEINPLDIAEMCGTSITQIERVYYHKDEETKKENAFALVRGKEKGKLRKKEDQQLIDENESIE